ncbi:related to mRNA export factor MEX67 [Phialocephala subalpina]|uniref:mRNA export factor MEX67 n=1 Tax=Phialocephala subalpina TaxID=576137 RepID=A0A1L7WD91_9HELO|nr:related to mRNA export factor MEX67 [Phialocephala subalpina]
MLQSAPRAPRGDSPNIRSSRGRGGIQKRRAGGPVRVDRDGDLDMDPATAGEKRRSAKGRMEPSRPAGTGRTNSGPARGGSIATARAKQAIMRGIGRGQANVLESRITTTGNSLQVEGLSSSKAASNPDRGVEALLAFLERKASGMDAKSNRTVKIKKSSLRGDKVIITASPEDIATLQKLDGFTFAGSVLSIKSFGSPSGKTGESVEQKKEPSAAALALKDRFRQVLAARYNPDLKLLNLSSIVADPGLAECFQETTNPTKVFQGLMIVCDGLFKTRAEKKEAIVSVTLANNSLANVGDANILAQTFPDLQNVDLSGNNLADMKSLDAWRYKLRLLENLVLSGNPIEAQLATLKDEFLKRYPNLMLLNNVQVRSPEQLAELKAKAEAAASPLPIAGPDFRDVGQVGENFVRQLLPLYDNDRSSLLTTFYDSNTTFSLSINTSTPRNHQNSKPIPPWADYMKNSRNLVRITHPGTRLNRSFKGVEAIKGLWTSLPATHHPDLSQTDKYIIECHSLPGLPDPSGQSARGVDGLIITIHGEFEEGNTTAADKPMRSFSRTIILGPGIPGFQPIRVISDMLALRAWGPLAQPQPAAMHQTPPQQHVQMAMPEQQKQEAMAMQLMEKTGMTLNYAALCLSETGWDLEKAFAAFTANKDKLPADAFLANVAR